MVAQNGAGFGPRVSGKAKREQRKARQTWSRKNKNDDAGSAIWAGAERHGVEREATWHHTWPQGETRRGGLAWAHWGAARGGARQHWAARAKSSARWPEAAQRGTERRESARRDARGSPIPYYPAGRSKTKNDSAAQWTRRAGQRGARRCAAACVLTTKTSNNYFQRFAPCVPIAAPHARGPPRGSPRFPEVTLMSLRSDRAAEAEDTADGARKRSLSTAFHTRCDCTCKAKVVNITPALLGRRRRSREA